MDKTPLVSILMTAYNREKYIPQAIESVLSLRYDNFELIIVDDQSHDNTTAICKSYEKQDKRIRLYINEENLGDYSNRNKAASYAKGKYIKYLDADDMIYDYGLQVMVESMERFPDSGFGLASLASYDEPFPIQLTPRQAYLEHFGSYGHFDRAPGSSIIKTEAFRIVGGFSGKRMIGDYEFWFKIARYYNMVKFPMDLYWSRVHHEQESQSGYASEYPKLKKAILEDALKHEHCPLNSEDMIVVKNNMRKSKNRDMFFRSVSKIKRSLYRN